MSQLTSELARIVSMMEGVCIDVDSDYKDLQKISDVIGRMQAQIERLDDWRALGQLKKHMKDHAIERVVFSSDYESDDEGGGSMSLAVGVFFLKSSSHGMYTSQNRQYEAESKIHRMFTHRNPETMDGLKVHYSDFDAFVQKFVGAKEFAANEKTILERTAKPASRVQEPPRV